MITTATLMYLVGTGQVAPLGLLALSLTVPFDLVSVAIISSRD